MSFLGEMFAGLKPGEFIELRHQPDPASKRMRSTFYTSVVDAERAGKELSKSGHVYYGIAPRSVRRGTKEAIQRVQAVWVDLDDKKELPPWTLPPTFVVDSGYGLHLYWLLNEPADPSLTEDLSKRLGEALGGDAVWDRARIFRLPGSKNFKRDPKGVACRALASLPVRYSTDDLYAALRVPKRYVEAINSTDAGGYKSRSEKDWMIVNGLRQHGVTAAAATLVLRYSASGDKARESAHYVDQTVKKAYESKPVSEDAEEDAITPPAGLVEDEAGYFMEGPNGRRQLSSFLLKPKYVVHPDDGSADAVVATVVMRGKEVFDVVLGPDRFVSKDRFYKAVRHVSCVWRGSDRDLAVLQQHLTDQVARMATPTLEATSVLGRFGDYWIGTDRIMDAKQQWSIDNAPVKYINPNRPFLVTDYTPAQDTPAVLAQMMEVFPSLNHREVLAPLLGWIAACPFKEVLWANQGTRFPILNVFGTRGSGKTVTVNFVLLPLLGVITHRSHESTTTPYVRLSMLGATNGLPISLTEFRTDNSFRDQAFAGQLRELYDHAVDSRGRTDLSTAQFPLLAPLILDGEDALSEPALLERLIQVQMRPEVVAPRSTAAKALKKWGALPVQTTADSYLRYTLGVRPKWSEAEALTIQALKNFPIRSDRVINNYTAVVLGLLHYKEWVESLGVEFPYDLTVDGVLGLISESLRNVVGESGRTTLLVDEFVTDVVNHFIAEGTLSKFAADYDIPTRTVRFQFATAFGWWITERQKQHRPILDVRAVRAQLEERMLDTDNPVVGQYVRYQSELVHTEGHVYRMIGISIVAAKEAGLDVPERIDAEVTE